MSGPTREQVETLLAGFEVGPAGHDVQWDEVRWFGGHAMHYDPWGEPCSLRVWCRLFEAVVHVPGARELYYYVGDEEVGNLRVATIWAGGHMGWEGLYETQVLGGNRGLLEWQYPTREKAEAGHQVAVQLVRDGMVR